MRVFSRATLALVLLGLATVATAGDSESRYSHQRAGIHRPHLGDHIFTSNLRVETPFIGTHLRNSLGIGQALDLAVIPEFVVDGDTIPGLQGDLLFALLAFEYQQRVQDWVAFYAEIDVTGRLGTDLGALVSEGVMVATGFELGWLARLYQSDSVALSGTILVENKGFTGVNIGKWAEGIVDGEPVKLVDKTPSLRTGGGLRVGWAINDLFGVLALAETSYGESPIRSEGNGWTTVSALAVSCDLGARTPVPIGISAGFEADSNARAVNDRASGIYSGSFRVAYTGRSDFLIALDSTMDRIPVANGETLDAGTMQITMQYWF